MFGKHQKPQTHTTSARTIRSDDSRVRFTREVLGDALVALMREQPFEQITVQRILDRAGVGRTTFYAHYEDKQDLFTSDVQDFLEGMAGYLDRNQAPAERLAPVEELLTHLAESETFYKALHASRKLTEVRELGMTCFSRSIERRLSQSSTHMPAAELRVTAQALSGALFALLDGWMFDRKKLSPRAVDQLFHSLAWKGTRP